jgi:hypothetical protein
MVLGMSIETFTLIHVVISLAGITSGIIVMRSFDPKVVIRSILPNGTRYSTRSLVGGGDAFGGGVVCGRPLPLPPPHLKRRRPHCLQTCGRRRIRWSGAVASSAGS